MNDVQRSKGEAGGLLPREQTADARFDVLRRQFQALARATLTITSQGGIEPVMQKITEHAAAIVGAHQAATSLTVDANRSQTLKAVWLSDKYARHREHREAMLESAALCEVVCGTNQPMRLTPKELRASAGYRHADPKDGHARMRGWMAAPLIDAQGKNVGLIELSDKLEGDFDEEDESLLVQLSHIASIAISNARLYEAVEQSEGQYRFLAESIPQIAWTANPDGLIDYVNQRWFEYTGFTWENTAGHGYAAAIHPQDREEFAARWCESLRAGQPLEFSHRLRDRSGEYRWFLIRALAMRDEADVVIRWFGTCTDIHDQKEAEEALRDSEERLRLALWAANVGTWRVDLDTHVDTRDASFNRILGLDGVSSTQPAGDFIARVHPDDRDRIQAALGQAISERGTYDAECRILRPDGSVRWLRDRGKVFCAGHGDAVYMTGAAADITEQKEAQRERDELLQRERAAREEAERLNRLKDEFLATVSHELRTPLTAILGWSRMLKYQDVEPDRIQKAVSVIERNAKSQSQLIEDILDVSAIIAGKVRINPRPTSVRSFIEGALETVRPAADARGVEIEAEFDQGLGDMVGDEDRLQQVIWNLVSNGVKFTPRGGVVRVQARSTDAEVVIVVSDTGKGIKPEFLPFIFDRFRQADPTTTRAYGGLGLGLAIVRHLVEMHGGSVDAESDGEDAGTRVTIRLPIRDIEEMSDCGFIALESSPGERFSVLPQTKPLEGLHVMVVDDDADARDLLSTVLEHAGASPATAGSVHEAMDVLHQHSCDVLVSDIGMPGEDGHVLIQRIRALGADNPLSRVPAVALTAYARADDRRRALASGFQVHVAKPIEPTRLIEVVARLVRRPVSVSPL